MAQKIIRKVPVASLGYGFVAGEFLPDGKDEYYLRNQQNKSGIEYRNLTAFEIEVLVRNRNTCSNWNNFLVSDAFNPELVKGCSFFGLVRIGKLEPLCLEFNNLKFTVGLYNSKIISCDFGDNVVIEDVDYLSHFIIGNEVILFNVKELTTNDTAKFGEGLVKRGEEEDIRIWLELCNENGGRKVMPFSEMLPGDAFLWSHYRDDAALLAKLKSFTQSKFLKERGYYGIIGDRCVIKNCESIKDVWIGSDAYIKGANKLKNLTIHSTPADRTQIGEGCELVNGIINEGCRIFYGVKAVRFIMASNSQLKYGARLINSYLGNNSTISCCEVLNSLIFPSHEQHHNNSFLCAALIMGQSNIPAGATLGSNHNSRSADGEIAAGRGFWPGLCVSIKHNCRFASFTLLAKGDYSYELNMPLPFSLVSLDLANDSLQVMPAYWFMYNMYALARNSWKYEARDHRKNKQQHLEYNYLAPDTVNEMFDALQLLQCCTGAALLRRHSVSNNDIDACIQQAKQMLEANDVALNTLEILADGFENSKRKTVISKAGKAYQLYKEMILLYGLLHLIEALENDTDYTNSALERHSWINFGGQLMPEQSVHKLKRSITQNNIQNWDEVHAFYLAEADEYVTSKQQHALASLQEVTGLTLNEIMSDIGAWLNKAIAIQEALYNNIYNSREKDYNNEFRKMMYSSAEEMDNVIGSLQDNSFIIQQQQALQAFKQNILVLKGKLKTVTA